jgi:hypothetical protein
MSPPMEDEEEATCITPASPLRTAVEAGAGAANALSASSLEEA